MEPPKNSQNGLTTPRALAQENHYHHCHASDTVPLVLHYDYFAAFEEMEWQQNQQEQGEIHIYHHSAIDYDNDEGLQLHDQFRHLIDDNEHASEASVGNIGGTSTRIEKILCRKNPLYKKSSV